VSTHSPVCLVRGGSPSANLRSRAATLRGWSWGGGGEEGRHPTRFISDRAACRHPRRRQEAGTAPSDLPGDRVVKKRFCPPGLDAQSPGSTHVTRSRLPKPPRSSAERNEVAAWTAEWELKGGQPCAEGPARRDRVAGSSASDRVDDESPAITPSVQRRRSSSTAGRSACFANLARQARDLTDMAADAYVQPRSAHPCRNHPQTGLSTACGGLVIDEDSSNSRRPAAGNAARPGAATSAQLVRVSVRTSRRQNTRGGITRKLRERVLQRRSHSATAELHGPPER
jgi:hypothetical protein